MNFSSEGFDWVECLYDALPKWKKSTRVYRRYYRKGGRGRLIGFTAKRYIDILVRPSRVVGPIEKLDRIWRFAKEIDVAKAVEGCAFAQLQDVVYGLAGQAFAGMNQQFGLSFMTTGRMARLVDRSTRM